MRSTSLPVGVVRSKPSCTLANVPPARSMRSIWASESISVQPEAVELDDDDAACVARFDATHRLVELRRVELVAGYVEFVVHLGDAMSLRLGPRCDLLTLDVGLMKESPSRLRTWLTRMSA